MLFGLRFDLRNPAFAGVSTADRYAAALDMAAWADGLGAVNITVSEHHGSPDGYLPSPIPLLAAMATRTTNVRFMIAAMVASFHDPLRLAEDMSVLDNLSRGRVDLVLAGGYVREEFAMFDAPMGQRGKRVAEAVSTLKAAFTGEPFEYRGRTAHITPAPFTPGGPPVLIGGSGEAAARRAARLADGFLPSIPEVWQPYRDEVIALGRPDPGPGFSGTSQVVALAADVDRGWEQMGPYFLHEMNAYGAWQAQDGVATAYRTVTDIESLKASGEYRILTPDEFVAEQKAAPFAFQMFHPMCGGMPIDVAWSSLRLFEHEVLPAFAAPPAT